MKLHDYGPWTRISDYRHLDKYFIYGHLQQMEILNLYPETVMITYYINGEISGPPIEIGDDW